jgi:hypothetical protein
MGMENLGGLARFLAGVRISVSMNPAPFHLNVSDPEPVRREEEDLRLVAEGTARERWEEFFRALAEGMGGRATHLACRFEGAAPASPLGDHLPCQRRPVSDYRRPGNYSNMFEP